MDTRRLHILVGMLAALALCALAMPVAAQSEQRCFAETGLCIAGRIRAFWEQNGGLPVFGFPVGPQHEEPIEGRPYQVQWFERQRLELHPENAPPYDVLLGRLSADRLAQQGRNWPAFPRSEPQADCRFFPETGHNVCGALLAAWYAGGLEFDGESGASEAENLALFGLPLSDPLTETIEGQPYTVQWFERARFELHPENAAPYDVLFGLLGNEVHGSAPQPPSPPVSGHEAQGIDISAGRLLIDGVQIGDRFPPDCLPASISCSQVRAGYQVLIVWLARQDGGRPSDLAKAVQDESTGAYVTSGDGARHERFADGLVNSRLFVAFITPVSARGFTLHWPGNPAIDLGQ
jgi:hypothetical protein